MAHLLHRYLFMLLNVVTITQCGRHEQRLLKKLQQALNGWNVYERPSEEDSAPLKVEMGLTLQQIIDVDEKNQIIYTNMWVTMRWKDYKLQWDPADYANISQIAIPANIIWKPDILMYNSAADAFDAKYQSGVRVDYDGSAEQIPPGMFKSTCHIDIKWFPFDQQKCTMKFGSWTYDGTKIDLRFLDGLPEGSTAGFAMNGEWDIIEFPAERNVFTYECCPQNPFVDLTYTLRLKRRKLYYLINIVAPCMLFAFLGLFTFCIPPDAGEKVRCWREGITVLLSLTVFMMIVSETLPETSEAIPLIAIYFMGIMAMTALSVVATITSLIFHHRSGETHTMSKFAKVVIGEWLAWILRMRRPGTEPPCKKKGWWKRESDIQMLNVNTSQSLLANIREQEVDNENFYASIGASTHGDGSNHTLKLDAHPLSPHNINSHSNHSNLAGSHSSQPMARLELRAILKELRYLTAKEKEKANDDKISSDWKWCAMVLDRLFIWIVGIINVIVAASVILSAPDLFN
ncbi:neuronal acetylcholine receptor subunit alpha-7-like [Watersipora subatra]|uniref:neuronal acetylcholine receptor subunit alpha-7-like n=1 Tax=Watersipora subatra TaxID=2589382 RepID=UPI00355C4076